MLKKIVLYPFLFVLDIILIPLSANLDQIDPSQALRPLVVLLAMSGVILVLLALILRDWHYAGYLTFLILAFQFLTGHLWRLVQDQTLFPSPTRPVLLGIWAVLLAMLAIPRVWKRLGGGRRVTPLLNLLFGVVILSQVLFTLPEIWRGMAPPASTSASPPLRGDTTIPQLDCGQRPDIYYIILDAYGRSDVLGEYYGVDNSAFLQSLRDKGFYLADRTHTNYTQTIFSVASALNMETIGPNPPQVSGEDYFTRLIAENELSHLLKKCGYQTVAFNSGFYFTDQTDVDVYLTSEARLTEFENLLLADSPVSLLADQLGWMKQQQSYQAHRERVLFAFEELGKMAGKPGPKFVFAHILSPHPPFVFSAQGQPTEPSRSYSIGDGDDYRGSREEYRHGYAGQVAFVDSMLEKTIDEILTGSQIPPIIILQGDHGPGSQLNWHSPSKTCLAERTAILNAYYLPGYIPGLLYPEISPMNSFRVILNHYFGARLELQPDKTYFTSHRLERQVIDITDERDSTANCVPISTAKQ